MTLKNYNTPDIALAWMRFVTTGELEAAAVRPVIAESWQRCRQAGVNPYDGTCQSILEPAELEALLERHQELIELARPFMLNLYQFFEGSGYIVLLSDERGYILEVFGDQTTLKEAVGLNFIQGASWTENSVGTNAIGTTLVLKKPLQVSGPEHYCRRHHAWTCSAAPLFDAEGRVLGILDLSGPSSEAHSHTLGMVVAAQQAIREQLLVRQKNRELTLANNQLNKLISAMSDGMLTFDKDGRITGLNPAAEKITGRGSRELKGKVVQGVFSSGHGYLKALLSHRVPFHDAEIRLDSPDGVIRCLASGEPVLDDTGTLSGGLLLIRPIERVQQLVNRFSGAQASFHFKDIIGRSRVMKEAIRLATRAADGQATVLLQGESGTGKELFAQAIHNRSSRRGGPFVAVNCGAIPRELLASELFGYEEGAFTGAKRGGRPGKFELASGGTLFLDEMGEMPLEQQVALLRVLQEKRVTRVGGSRSLPVDVRVICATNKDLAREVEKGHFRRDLYYRVNVLAVTIPPLRERPEDIPLLFRHFLERLSREWGVTIEEVDPEVLSCLQGYDWPGNVRELQNVVERMVSLAENNRLEVRLLPPRLRQPQPESVEPGSPGLPVFRLRREREQLKRARGEEERRRILELLQRWGGNVTRAARDFGCSRNTFYRKMKRYNILNR